jgi:hypothetical protein
MSDTPIHAQRLAALTLAVQKKRQFDSIEEMRNIKMMVILSFLIEFECATSETLLDLLEIKSNAILTRMVKNRFIKLFRWQNHVVYVPTALGKKWLLDRLDNPDEIERVQNSKIRRKIGGYSSEHDLLVQRAAINYARQDVRPGEQWRIFKPKKTGQEGIVCDAKIVFTKGKYSRRIWVEVERTPKPPVEAICKFLNITYELGFNNDRAAFLCTKKKILLDYFSIYAAFDCGMFVPQCAVGTGVGRHVLQEGEWMLWRSGKLERIDLAMIDGNGEIVDDSTAPIEAIFCTHFWLLALQQRNKDWKNWAKEMAGWVINYGTMPTYLQDDEHEENAMEDIEGAVIAPIQTGPDDGDFAAARARQAKLLIEWLEGPRKEDNPMRSAADLLRAEERYKAWLASTKLKV